MAPDNKDKKYFPYNKFETFSDERNKNSEKIFDTYRKTILDVLDPAGIPVNFVTFESSHNVNKQIELFNSQVDALLDNMDEEVSHLNNMKIQYALEKLLISLRINGFVIKDKKRAECFRAYFVNTSEENRKTIIDILNNSGFTDLYAFFKALIDSELFFGMGDKIIEIIKISEDKNLAIKALTYFAVTVDSAKRYANEIMKLLKKTNPSKEFEKEVIFNKLMENVKKSFEFQYELIKNKSMTHEWSDLILKLAFEENFSAINPSKLTKDLLAVMQREEIAELKIEELPIVELKVIPALELLTNPDYQNIKLQIVNLIKKLFPKGDDQQFLDYLKTPSAKLHIVTANNQVLVFFGTNDMGKGISYLDWYMSNPVSSIKGLAEAAMVHFYNNYIENDCYLAAKPHVKSLQIFIERLGFVAFGATKDGEYKHHYLRCRKMKEEYNGKKLDESEIEKIKNQLKNEKSGDLKDFPLPDGSNVKICKIEFHGQDHTFDITKNSEDGELFKIMEEFSNENMVLVRYIPDTNNNDKHQTFYCIFEESKLTKKRTEDLYGQINKVHALAA